MFVEHDVAGAPAAGSVELELPLQDQDRGAVATLVGHVRRVRLSRGPNRSGGIGVVLVVNTWLSDDRYEHADRRLLGWVVAFGVSLVLGAVGWNPFNVDLGPMLEMYVWIGLLVIASALVWVVSWSFRHWFVRKAVAAVGVFLVASAAMLTPLVLFFTESVHDEVVLASRGRLELVRVTATAWIDPFYRVELRRSIGPLQQTVVVWEGNPAGNGPSAAAFTGASEVEVSVRRYERTACRYRSSFDPLTLTLDVRYDDGPRFGGGC